MLGGVDVLVYFDLDCFVQGVTVDGAIDVFAAAKEHAPDAPCVIGRYGGGG